MVVRPARQLGDPFVCCVLPVLGGVATGSSVLEKAHAEPDSIIQDFFLAFSFMGPDGELLVKRTHIWNILLTQAVTDEEATTVYNLVCVVWCVVCGVPCAHLREL